MNSATRVAYSILGFVIKKPKVGAPIASIALDPILKTPM